MGPGRRCSTGLQADGALDEFTPLLRQRARGIHQRRMEHTACVFVIFHKILRNYLLGGLEGP